MYVKIKFYYQIKMHSIIFRAYNSNRWLWIWLWWGYGGDGVRWGLWLPMGVTISLYPFVRGYGMAVVQ